MRHMVTCFSEHAVRISELSSCSSSSSSYVHQTHPSIPPNSSTPSPSVQNAVVYLYKTPLLSQQDQPLLITITWSRDQLGQGGLCISFGSSPSSPSFKLNSFSRLFRRKKGQRSLEVESLKFDVFWDLSAATYHCGPEPVDGYYILLTVGLELGLALGDLAQDAASRRLGPGKAWPKWSLLSRREHYSGSALYCTTARFCDEGMAHEIVIRCSEEQERMRQPVLHVSIDNRSVMKIRRLQWNFRGNQTVFIDGRLVDLVWDVHEWFYGSGSGQAVFMFKTRTGMDNRLWLEEKLWHKHEDTLDFSLLIYATKNP